MDASAILYPAGWHWTKTELTYYVHGPLEAWTPYIHSAMENWDRVSGLDLVQVGSAERADIEFTTLADLDAPHNAKGWSVFWADEEPLPAIVRGFVGLPDTPDLHGPAESLWIALHEIGHVLGLSHPHQHHLGLDGDHSLTVMSYVGTAEGHFPAMPGPVDVAAVQRLYGFDRELTGDGSGAPLAGGPGYDLIRGSAADDTILGHQGADILYGHAGDDVIHGGRDDDTLFGGRGDDLLMGGAGDDVLHGGTGNDTLDGGTGADLFVFGTGGGDNVVVDFDAAAGDRIVLVMHGPVLVWSAAEDGSARLDTGRGTTVTLLGVDPASAAAEWLAA
ncbi:matrixin family metalloprotease [Azospirillum halopraeferens]|uniref:matrixin family metalloprotease n=1 Tax=Azospirillum halopraeferens TaxID=34010 RepID=UPI00042168BF|nr:matrixin family metalloprotease [Azospirillum halopraeferens]